MAGWPYEEHQELSALQSWAIIVMVCLLLMGFGLLTYLLVPDAPRRPDFGVRPDAPGESIYSTMTPDSRTPFEPQIPPLSSNPAPEAASASAGGEGLAPRP